MSVSNHRVAYFDPTYTRTGWLLLLLFVGTLQGERRLDNNNNKLGPYFDPTYTCWRHTYVCWRLESAPAAIGGAVT